MGPYRRCQPAGWEGPCFVSAILAGHPDYAHHDVYEDEDEDEHGALQRTVHRIARTVAQVVPAERVYCMSLGSQQGNDHLHWHIAPLPPGVPSEDQQLAALSAERGHLDVTEESQAALARAIRSRL
jgi:diadenosine tetraphosphate (Ap4A) HIT family hydrolase